MIKAKWSYLIRHFSNRHEGHENSLFPKCVHGELQEPRIWIPVGKFKMQVHHYFLITLFNYYYNVDRTVRASGLVQNPCSSIKHKKLFCFLVLIAYYIIKQIKKPKQCIRLR